MLWYLAGDLNRRIENITMQMQGDTFAQGILNGLVATQIALQPIFLKKSFDVLARYVNDLSNEELLNVCSGLFNSKDHLSTIQMWMSDTSSTNIESIWSKISHFRAIYILTVTYNRSR